MLKAVRTRHSTHQRSATWSHRRPKEKHFRVTQRDTSGSLSETLLGRRGRAATAPALATRLSRGLLGRGGRGRAPGALRSGDALFWARATGSGVETEAVRGRNARSMKRQAASSERKRARMPSGKAGAANGFLMEVCVDSVESAINAERGGAGRIELCSGLLEGGTTPSMGILQVVKQCVQIPVFVMIRPRGGDFLYSDREVEVMKADIRLAKLYGADGLVFGALTEDGHIDKELCMSLMAICRPLPVTFHRAFDMVHDPVAALETLLTLGFERVLTSGCDSSALEGLPLIKRLIDQAKGRIVVMPGGGITDKNLQRILEGSGATEFHCSARSSRDSGMKFRNFSVAMGASLSSSEYSLKVTDVTQVRTLNAIAKNILV